MSKTILYTKDITEKFDISDCNVLIENGYIMFTKKNGKKRTLVPMHSIRLLEIIND